MYVIRDCDSYVCQIDGKRFPFTSTDKYATELAAQAHADSILYNQTQAGIRPDTSLAERQRLLAAGIGG